MLLVISLATHDCILSMTDKKLMMTIRCWSFNMWIYSYRYSLKRTEKWLNSYCKIPCTLVPAYLRDVRGWDSKNPIDTTLPSLIIKYESVWLLLKSSSKLPTQMEYLHKAFPPPTTDKGERKSPLLFSCYDCLLYPWLDFMV